MAFLDEVGSNFNCFLIVFVVITVSKKCLENKQLDLPTSLKTLSMPKTMLRVRLEPTFTPTVEKWSRRASVEHDLTEFS